MINTFDDDLDKDPLPYKFKVEFEKNTPSSKDTYLKDAMSYNDILDYTERENNNEDGQFWKFRKILIHSLISGKKGKDNKFEIKMLWETGAIYTEYFESLESNIPVAIAIYAK